MPPGSSQQYDRAHGSNASTTSYIPAENDDENCSAESKDLTQEKYKCCGCLVQFDNENELMEHAQAVHGSNASKPNETNPFQCKVCYHLFDTVRAMNIHRSHFSQRRRSCKVCGASLKNGIAVLRHQKCLLKPENHYPCRLCGENFTYWISRKKHEQNEHHDTIEKSYKCCGCCTQFRTEKELLYHSRSVHAPWAPPPAQGRPFQCKTCYRSFKTAGNLKTHVDSKKYSFQCTTCEKQFSCYSSLIRHEKLHNKTTRPCKYCRETFSNRFELRKHEYGVHKEERANLLQHVCSVCGKTFRSADYLRIHTKLHADATPYKCFCGAQFKLKVYLTSHRKTVHNEGHTCKYCKKSFPYASLLKEHENQHRGNKEIQCEFCGKEFYTSSSARHHMQKVHGKIKKRA
ncbi:zinc finger protein 345-like [Anopheles ziemanni]|nr:zinc finger protein 345-like [Anopheles ziemanni]